MIEYVTCDDCRKKVPYDESIGNDSGDWCEDCYQKMWKQGARDAGIPELVIEGKTKLRDHFSQEYIDHQCKRNLKGRSIYGM